MAAGTEFPGPTGPEPGAVEFPGPFARAVRELKRVRTRPEVSLEEIPPPRRLAPYAFAYAASVEREAVAGPVGEAGSGDAEIATGRLILLHDPAGHEAWSGTMRLITFVTADVEPEIVADPLLPAVAWTWLIDALDAQGVAYTAAGGTVTQTSSTRFGELADDDPEPVVTAGVEIRASWTPLGSGPGALGADLAGHLEAWCVLLATAAGLPPPGIARIGA